MPSSTETGGPDLRIGIFFDGTGNHKDLRATAARPTNIAALYDLYATDGQSVFAAYVSGIGVYDSAGNLRGDPLSLATGLGKSGGYARMADAAEGLLAVFQRVWPFPPARIVLDVFGFSRGAALARHFVNAVLLAGLPDPRRPMDASAVPRPIRPNLRVIRNQGYGRLDCPLEIGFLGLFDTVGSFGLPGNADEGDFDVTLGPEIVARTLHLTAANEYRRNFPLRSIYDGAPNTGNEAACPGAHGDVGGGYAPPGAANPEHILVGAAEVSARRGGGSTVYVFPDTPPELEALFRRILTPWPGRSPAALAREALDKHGLVLRRAPQAASEGDEILRVRFFVPKRTRETLGLVPLRRMRDSAARHGAPFRELDPEREREASRVAAARAGDPLAFWRDYIHLSAVADTRYSRCFSLSADGRVILRPGLTEADLPKTRHIADGIFLVDGPAASGRRVIFDNGRKK